MHNKEAIQMMRRCRDEINQLRAQISDLKPKADAYDKLAIILDMLPQRSVAMGEDLVWMIDKRIKEIEAAEVASADPAPTLRIKTPSD